MKKTFLFVLLVLTLVVVVSCEPEAKHEHSWGEWTEKTAGTCTVKAKETRTCSTCEATEERDGNTVSDNHPEDKCAYKFESEPTFLTSAQRKEYCSACEKYTGKVGEYEYASVEGFWVSDEETSGSEDGGK